MDEQQIQALISTGGPAAFAIASSPVALKLIDRIGDYIGIRQKPIQILEEGEAQAYSDAKSQLIKQSLDVNVSEEQRVLARGLLVETNKVLREQRNRESIVSKALSKIKDYARPEEVEEDWYANFFDKSRLVSDEEMQLLWAKVLAGEVNEPGKYSRRTVAFLSGLDKKDALLFRNLCSFSINGSSDLPVFLTPTHSIYFDRGLELSVVKNFEGMGLVSYNDMDSYGMSEDILERFNTVLARDYGVEVNVDGFHFCYGGINFRVNNVKLQRITIGRILLTSLGREIASLCVTNPVEGFAEYLMDYWTREKYEEYEVERLT